jgi:hypothetical protein
MKMKASPWMLLSAIIFTITTIYWYTKYSEDKIGIIIFAVASILFYIGAIGNWKSGN